jgi:CcmD family protein
MLPALPLDEAGKYVAAAYIVFVLLIFVYVAIMASRLSRIEREVVELADLVEARDKSAAAAPERAKEPVAQ